MAQGDVSRFISAVHHNIDDTAGINRKCGSGIYFTQSFIEPVSTDPIIGKFILG